MIYYNCHTHIFSAQYVPNNVVGVPIMKALASDPISSRLTKFFGRLRYGAVNTEMERIARFAEIGLGTRQEVIFNYLEDYYKGWGDVRFVILMMDMEQMGAGRPMSNFKTQVDEIVRLRSKGHYKDRLLPFLFVDPRRPEFTTGKKLLDWVKSYFEDYGFVGIKMYPALGYYPFDEKLDELYAWAEEKFVPITYHCIEGVIYYRGDLKSLAAPRFSNQYHNLSLKKNAEYQRNFTEPQNYFDVMKRFPQLKINLGHYAGEDEIKKNGRWYSTVKALMMEYDNVYADVSFTLNDTGTHSRIHSDINTPKLGDKILFGTDYYVVEKNKDEAMLRDELRNKLNELDAAKGSAVDTSFNKIAAYNPIPFLSSAYYSA
jgi:hypothetical protein